MDDNSQTSKDNSHSREDNSQRNEHNSHASKEKRAKQLFALIQS